MSPSCKCHKMALLRKKPDYKKTTTNRVQLLFVTGIFLRNLQRVRTIRLGWCAPRAVPCEEVRNWPLALVIHLVVSLISTLTGARNARFTAVFEHRVNV